MRISVRRFLPAIFGVFLSLLALGGCVTSTGRYGIYTDVEIFELEKQTAKVGEEVTIAIRGTLALSAESELPDTDFKDVLIGACFESDSDFVKGGYCGVGSTPEPLPNWIKVFPKSDSHFNFLGTVNLNRGGRQEETLTFSFTSTVPARLQVSPWLYSNSRRGAYGFGNYSYTIEFTD